MLSTRVQAHVLRLAAGDDLREALEAFAQRRGLRAAAVVTCVGSLRRAVLRFADARQGTVIEGSHEITSLVGTLSPDGPHLHIALADAQGRCVGGHLLRGSLVYTTAEIVLLECVELDLRREPDATTGFKELKVRRRVTP